ncbi:MAG: SAM-dependent methyltransferase [Thermoproteota archaeon]|uniref:Class I SAM-dependent methyltransferase n=1 Tax=Candidatus Methanodesulfokora washburnensis TaxID=2478471 RepID=A0A520KHQ6_9CREN|nr:MAG: class I SAM-dependent methyltransferase [Candidatus Methanodesulfokores washburnensis]TDA39580.1 MAG: SAM-dependent methyltransferase [Candidatus Korarchaeota archaeon]
MSESPFDLYYKEYDEWYERNRFAYLTELEALKREIPRNKRGLEVGVGTGRFASPLGVPFGIDPSVSMIKVAKDRGVEVVQGVGEEMPFPDSAFDYVLLAITICFLKDPDRTILEIRRILKPNGFLIIGIVDRESFLGRYYIGKKEESKFYKHARFFSVGEILELIKGHGFREKRIVQTVFDLPGRIKEVEEPKEGFGIGGFVVIVAEKA